jgi:hypothetical protein
MKKWGNHVTQAPFLERSLRSGENSLYKNCGEAATAALGPAGPVKPKNPWALGPFILRIFLHNPFTQPAAPAAPLCAQRTLNPFESLVPLCYDGCILFKGDESVNIKLVLLGLLALFSLYRLYEHNDFMTLCATVIVVAAFVLSAFHLWRRRQ